MPFLNKDNLKIISKKNRGFAIPQALILGVGIAVGVSGLMAASILGLTGSRINRQELIAKSSSYSGIAALRALLNDSNSSSFYNYLWLVNSCSEEASNCDESNSTDPTQSYWSDDEWCNGEIGCNGRQKAPMCSAGDQISWSQIINNYQALFDDIPENVGINLENYTKQFNQEFKVISSKYTGTEKNGVNSILIEGMAKSNKSNSKTSTNKLRVNIQVISETKEEEFGFLSAGENELDGKSSLFLGNLNITPYNPTGYIIWRRNIQTNDDCNNIIIDAKALDSYLPSIGNGGIWVQPIGLPKQPRLANVEDIGILICTPNEVQKEGTNCILDAGNASEKAYRIHSLYARGPDAKFEISTTDDSKIILEIMGDIDISNGGLFCHKDGFSSCGSGKPENLTILFKQKTNLNGDRLVCDSDYEGGGIELKTPTVDFSNYEYPIDNDQLPGSTFLIDNTGENYSDKFSAFIFGPKLTFLSVTPESKRIQITSSNQSGNNPGMIVTSRGSYGWIKNTMGQSFDDKMVNIVLSSNSRLIPYLGQEELSELNNNEPSNIEIIGVGYKVNPLPNNSNLNPSANRVLLIYNKEDANGKYYLRTFNVDNINPDSQTSSEYSYPRGFAKMNSKSTSTHVDLEGNLDNLTIKDREYLDAFDIKLKKIDINSPRNFSGAAWVKNLCFDSKGEKTWEFSNTFIQKLSEWHGDEFKWGIRSYRGRSIILWDTLRDFKS